MPKLRFELDRPNGRTVLAVAGELDIATVEDFLAAVRDALGDGALTLDLRELTFMDSAGVRALDALLREASASGRSFTIDPRLHRNVAGVLRLTGMLDSLPLDRSAGA